MGLIFEWVWSYDVIERSTYGNLVVLSVLVSQPALGSNLSLIDLRFPLTKKHAAFFVHSPCHFVQLRAKCWALRAKGRASQGTNQNHCAKSCQIFGTSCQISCQPRHKLKSSCKSLMFVPISAKFLALRVECPASKAEPSSSALKSVHNYNFIAKKAKLS